MNFDAVTLDTCSLESQNYNLENGLLDKFEQFSKISDIDFIISEVVLGEMTSHMEKKTKEAFSSYKKALKDGLFYKIDDELTYDKIKRIQDLNIEDIVEKRIKKFREKTNLKIIPANNIDVQLVLKQYFSKETPFSEKKKEEFPDAIALQSLENWAQEENKNVLVISCDKDWMAYCEGKKNLFCINKIDVALDKITEQIETRTREIKRLIEEKFNKDSESFSELMDIIKGFLFEKSHQVSVEFYASSHFGYQDIDNIDYCMKDFYFKELDEKFMFSILDIQKNEVTVVYPIELQYHVEGEIGLFWYDKDEGVDVPMAQSTIDTDASVENELIIKLKISGDEMSIEDVSLSQQNFDIDLGWVEPDSEFYE